MQTVLKAAVISASLLLVPSAWADIYLGANASYNFTSLRDKVKARNNELGAKTDTSKPGMGFFVGGWITDGYGVEAGFDFIKKNQINTVTYNNASGKVDIKANVLYLDVLGRSSVRVIEKFSLVGAIGAGLFNSKGQVKVSSIAPGTDLHNLYSSNTTAPVLRLGIGLEAELGSSFAIRGMLRYQHILDNSSLLKYHLSANIGVLYRLL